MDKSQYTPRLELFQDAYFAAKDKKLDYLANLAQDEKWDYQDNTDKRILLNYLCYTYEKVKEDNQIEISEDGTKMCFNTGLLTDHGADIYAYFDVNKSSRAKEGQRWFLVGFFKKTEEKMRNAGFKSFPDIADYFTKPEDFIYDRTKEIEIDYDHIIDDNYDRFVEIGLEDKYTINAFLTNAVNKIIEKVKRNYKLAIPQYFENKKKHESKIQLLLPLFMQNKDVADLALVVDKGEHYYVGKTILSVEWAYVNSRRIVKPDVDWLKI